MAIIISGETTCSICDEVLDEEQEVYATSAFLRSEHPLWRFSDSGMHWDCFENWEHRADFVKALLEAVTSPNHEWGFCTAFRGEHCSVVLNLVLPQEVEPGTVRFECRRASSRENPPVTVWLHEVGVSLRTTLVGWDDWLKEEHPFDRCLCQTAWARAEKELRCISSEELLSMVDTKPVYTAWNARAERESKRDAEKASIIAEHNQALHSIIEREP